METFHLVIIKFLIDSDSCKDDFFISMGIPQSSWADGKVQQNKPIEATTISMLPLVTFAKWTAIAAVNMTRTLDAIVISPRRNWNQHCMRQISLLRTGGIMNWELKSTHHPIYFSWIIFQPKLEISGEIYSNLFLAYIVLSYYQINTRFRMQ